MYYIIIYSIYIYYYYIYIYINIYKYKTKWVSHFCGLPFWVGDPFLDPPLFAHDPLRATGLYGLRGESTFWIPPLSFHFSKRLHPIRVIHFLDYPH